MSVGAGGLQAQLNQIQQRLARLERQAAGGEQLTPNYLTLINGLVGANFTGLINALGLIIPAGTAPNPPTARRIEWTRQSDGAIVADLTAYDQGGAGQTSALEISQYDLGENADNVVSIAAGAGGSTAGLELATLPGAGTQAVLARTSGAGSRTILNQAGRSSFLQQLATIARYVDAGDLQVTWPGGRQFFVAGTILPDVPANLNMVILCSFTSIQGVAGYAFAQNVDPTGPSFVIQAASPDPFGVPPAGNVDAVDWLVLAN